MHTVKKYLWENLNKKLIFRSTQLFWEIPLNWPDMEYCRFLKNFPARKIHVDFLEFFNLNFLLTWQFFFCIVSCFFARFPIRQCSSRGIWGSVDAPYSSGRDRPPFSLSRALVSYTPLRLDLWLIALSLFIRHCCTNFDKSQMLNCSSQSSTSKFT